MSLSISSHSSLSRLAKSSAGSSYRWRQATRRVWSWFLHSGVRKCNEGSLIGQLGLCSGYNGWGYRPCLFTFSLLLTSRATQTPTHYTGGGPVTNNNLLKEQAEHFP